MAGFTRIIRAVVGTGLTFAVGVGAAVGVVGLFAMAFKHAPLVGVLRTAGKFSLVAFILGVVFAGIVALGARSRRVAELSIARFAAMGGGAGVLYFLFLCANAWSRWTLPVAILNFVVLTVIGASAAAGTVLIARRGRVEERTSEPSA